MIFDDQIRPLKKSNLSQDIVKKFIEIIMKGEVSPGEKLPPEQELMEIFGVGRSTLREAIGALVALELVEVKVPKGTFVTKSFSGFFTKPLSLMSTVSFDNIQELSEARINIETAIIELATEKATTDDYKRLDANQFKLEQADDIYDFLNADLEFHIIIAEIARNSFLLEVYNILREITKEWILKVNQHYSLRNDVSSQHKKIIAAIKSRSPKQAKLEMYNHLITVSDLLLKIKTK